MTPAPDRYAVIGHPINHSRSPWIHARFAQQTGERMVYTAIDAAPEELDDRVRDFFARGGLGLNVTVPHKQAVLPLLQELSERARVAGAVNLILRADDGRLRGDNTDGSGLVRDLTHNLGVPIAAQRLLLLGAGVPRAGSLGRCWRCIPPNSSSPTARRREPSSWRNGSHNLARFAARPTPNLRHNASRSSSTRLRPDCTRKSRRCQSNCSMRLPSATTWLMPATPPGSYNGRASMVSRAALRARACWSSRLRNPSSSGAVCGQIPPRCWPICWRAEKPWGSAPVHPVSASMKQHRRQRYGGH